MPAGGMPGGSTVQPSAAWTGQSWATGLQSKLHDFVKKALLKQLMFPGASVCDLFCGRGTDTSKWAQAEAGHYIGVDLSASALQGAREEWSQCGKPYPAYFCELNPCMSDLRARLEGHGLPADLVCCLGHLQDCFKEENMVKSLLSNVAALLKPGGFFLGITPDSSTIWYKYQKAVEGAIKTGSLRVNGALPRVRSELYSISFEDDRFNFYGTKYQLRFADDGLAPQSQLLVHFPSLIRLAEEEGLECVEIQNLFDFYEDFRNPFSEALRSTCGTLLDAKGRLPTQAHEILMLYTTFIFKRVDPRAKMCPQQPVITEDLEALSCIAKDNDVVRRHESGCSTEVTEPPSKKSKYDTVSATVKKQDSPFCPTDRAETAAEEVADGARGGHRSGEGRFVASEESILQVQDVEVERLSPKQSYILSGIAYHGEEAEQYDALARCNSAYITERPGAKPNTSFGVDSGQCHRHDEHINKPTTEDPKGDRSQGKRLEHAEAHELMWKRQKGEVDGQMDAEAEDSPNFKIPLLEPVLESAVETFLGPEHSKQLQWRLSPVKVRDGSSRSELHIAGANLSVVGRLSAIQNTQPLLRSTHEQQMHERLSTQLNGLSQHSKQKSGRDTRKCSAAVGCSELKQDETGENRCNRLKKESDTAAGNVLKPSVAESVDRRVDAKYVQMVDDGVDKKTGRGGTRKQLEPIVDAVVNPVLKDGLDPLHGGTGLLEDTVFDTVESAISSNIRGVEMSGAIGAKHDISKGAEKELVALHAAGSMEEDLEQQTASQESKPGKPARGSAGNGMKDQKQSHSGKLIDLTRRADREKGPLEPRGLSSSLSNFTRAVHHHTGSWSRGGGKSATHDEGPRRASARPVRSRAQRQQQQGTGGSRQVDDHFGRQGRSVGAGSVLNEQPETEMYRRPRATAFGYATGEGLATTVAVTTTAARNSLPPEPGNTFFTPSIYTSLPSRAHNMQEIHLVAGHPTSRVMSPSSGILGPGPRPPPPSFARLDGPPPNGEQASVDQQPWQSHPLPHDRRLAGVRPVGRFHRDEWGRQQDSSANRRTQRGLAPKFDSRNASLIVPVDEYGIPAQSGRGALVPVEAMRSHGLLDNWLQVNVPPNM